MIKRGSTTKAVASKTISKPIGNNFRQYKALKDSNLPASTA